MIVNCNDIILVAQGAEYNAVCRGLQAVAPPHPQILAIPMGVEPVTRYLKQIALPPSPNIWVMGLCGSLSEDYGVGDVVAYRECVYVGDGGDLRRLPCHGTLTDELTLASHAKPVNAITSDGVVGLAAEKRQLRQRYGTDVVDMEGFAILETLQSVEARVAMLRVVSDGCEGDLPDLNGAIDANGSLKTLPLAIALLKAPIAATRLIGGALQALSVLQQVAAQMWGSRQLKIKN